MNIGKGWRKNDMDYKKLSKNLKDAKWTNAGMTDDQPLEWDASDAITDLLARAEEAEERCKELDDRCKRLDEARERANEAAAKWESMYHMALERAEREEIARKQGKVMVCPVCQGRGRVHTSFYGYGNCTMEDVRNDKFPSVCRTCKGRGIIEVNEF